MPIIVPTITKAQIQKPYEIFNMSFIIYTVAAAPVENMIIYIPEAAATFGGWPKLISKGLNMTPPPMPTAPVIHPANKESKTNFTKFLPTISISPGINPSPYLIFIFYSLCTCAAAIIVIIMHNDTKTVSVIQSGTEHFSMPINDGTLLEPRIKVAKSNKK